MPVTSPVRGADFDVVVVGGGPAGATAARALADLGRSTCVLERSHPPRYKTCGGGLVRRAQRLLDVELGDAVERACHAVELNLLDAGLSFRVERPEPLVLMTMRAALDERLLHAAEEAGAVLRARCELLALEQERESVSLRTSSGTLRARYVVACDGALGPTARAADFPPHPRSIPALESEIRVAPADLERFAASARFDFGAIEGGYAWVFPKREHLSVGCLSTRRGARELRAELERYLALLGLERIEAREDHGFVIPIAPRHGPASRGRVLLTGDAAGFADPVTCEGISYAISSARIAARAVAEHFGDAVRVRGAYERGLAREILPELRRARLLALLLYQRPSWRTALFRRAGSELCEAMADLISGDVSYRSLLRSPANHLRLARRFFAKGNAARRSMAPASSGASVRERP